MIQSLDWDEYEVVECLGVVPIIEEYKAEYSYKVETDTLHLWLHIYPEESIVLLRLYQNAVEEPLVQMNLVVRGKVRCVKDEHGEYLVFGQCVVGPDFGSSGFAWKVFANEESYADVDCELRIKPGMRVQFV